MSKISLDTSFTGLSKLSDWWVIVKNNFLAIVTGHNELENRVNNIVASAGTSNAEIVDARHSSSKSKDFTVLTERLEEIEADHASFVAENTQMLEEMSLSKTKEINSSAMYTKAIEEIKMICINGLKQCKSVISGSSALKVAVIGTSISETAGLNNSEDGYFVRLQKLISKALFGVNVTFQNFALAGRRMDEAASATYLAVNPEPTDLSTGFWRTWATAGKSWRDHIKDFAPDLLIIEFGMNDSLSKDSDYNFQTNLDSFITYVKTWTKVPDIVIVPTILPTTNTQYTSQSQIITNAVARSAREYAVHNGYVVADVNRLWRILLGGEDEGTTSTTVEKNFAGFPTGWVGSPSSFTLADNTLTPASGLTAAFAVRNKNFYNGTIDVDVNPFAGSTPWITYRENINGKMALLITPGSAGAANVKLYAIGSAGIVLATASNLTIPAGQNTHIKIEADGISHKVYVAGALAIDITTYRCLSDGINGFGASAGLVPIYANAVMKYDDPITFKPIFTELELLGPYNDLEADGNGINHPTPLGNAVTFVPAFGFIDELAR